jgi:hypothetical protein
VSRPEDNPVIESLIVIHKLVAQTFYPDDDLEQVIKLLSSPHPGHSGASPWVRMRFVRELGLAALGKHWDGATAATMFETWMKEEREGMTRVSTNHWDKR